jgi:hypothetical protein
MSATCRRRGRREQQIHTHKIGGSGIRAHRQMHLHMISVQKRNNCLYIARSKLHTALRAKVAASFYGPSETQHNSPLQAHLCHEPILSNRTAGHQHIVRVLQ